MNDSRDVREPIFDRTVEPIFDELDEYTPTGPHNASHMRAVFEPDEFGGRTLPRVTNDPVDRRNRTIIYVVAAVLLIGTLALGWQLKQSEWNPLLAYLTPFVIVTAITIGGFILLNFLLMIRRDGWNTFRDRLRRRNLEDDLEKVRQIAGSPGRRFEICNMIFWTDLPGDVETQFQSIVDKILREFSRATGFAATEGPPIRIFCFAREAEFMSYLRSEFPQLAKGDHFRSFHFHHRKTSGSKIVICCDQTVIFPWTLDSAMAYEITGLLLRTHLNGQQPPWFERGMATMISQHVDPVESAPGTAHRLVRAEANRRKLLSGCRIVTTNWMHILRRWQSMKGVERMSWFGRFDGQSALFCRYLSEHYPQAFHAFLRTRLTQADVQKLAAIFQKHFQAGPNELMWDCMARELDRAVPPYASPPEAIKQRIESEFVSQIVNGEASPEDRKFAISKLSGSGYPWRADVLIRILDGPDQELRDDALFALESLAGEVRGPRARDWTEWLNSLPDRVARKL